MDTAAAAAPPLPIDGLAAAKARLTLERVIGITSLSNAMVAVNPVTGEIAYAAGCIVVIYNLRRNKQVRYYRVEKSVACLCFSPTGQYLAIGEKGYLPAITIWDGTDGTLCAELQLHKFGVACMAFSRDGQFLLSAGLVHDQHLFVWDLRPVEAVDADAAPLQMRGVAIGAAQIHEKVLAMDFCDAGNFFVTVGEKHFKFWFLDDDDAFLLTGYDVNSVPEIQHRDAVLSAKADATFTGVACGHGASRLKTFAVTSDGTLCCFGASCIMERLVSLEAARGNAICVTEAYVAVAGASAIVRLFDPQTLEYRATMPFAPRFGAANARHDAACNVLHPDAPHRYPAALAVRLSGTFVIALYSDRSLFVYDAVDANDIRVERSFLCHSGAIRDLQVAGRVRGVVRSSSAKGHKLVYTVDDATRRQQLASASATPVIPNNTFVTASDDNTIRLWHMDLHKQSPIAKHSRFHVGEDDKTVQSAWCNPFSYELLSVVYHDDAQAFTDDNSDVIVLGGTCASDDVLNIHASSSTRECGHLNGVRTVGIHPLQTQLVAGDKHGNVVVLALPSRTVVREISAHSTEVQCVALTPASTADQPCLLASGGRDKLVHLYDCSRRDAVVVATLDNHAAAITALQFTADGASLLSCSADKTVIVSDVQAAGAALRNRTLALGGTGGTHKIYAMALTTDSTQQQQQLVTLSNNRLDVHSVDTGALIASHCVGEQHHLDVCPANYCVALSGSLADRTIHVVDITSGETLADATGHGDVITAVKFTPDCRRLVSTSSDGCIFVWRLPDAIQSAIKARLPRVSDAHASLVPPPAATTARTPRERSAASSSAADSVLLPPPAPPIAASKAPRTPLAPSTKPRTAAAPIAVSAPLEPPSSNSKPRRKSTSTPDASSTHIVALAMPKKSSDVKGPPPRGWKTKGVVAAAGPMAKGPIEDWMRTRESAKRTVHVVVDSLNEATTATAASGSTARAELSIDREQTPEWARTIKTIAQATGGRVLPRTSSILSERRRRVAGTKWDERRAVPTPFDAVVAIETPATAESATIDTHEEANDDDDDDDYDAEDVEDDDGDEEEEREALALPPPVAVDSGLHASVVNPLDVCALNSSSTNSAAIATTTTLSTTSSLALERELLDKRRKQMETAHAVAAMNSRLLQLGLLKPQTLAQQQHVTFEASSDVDAPVASAAAVEIDASSNSESDTDAETDEHTIAASLPPKNELSSFDPIARADIPHELLESIDVGSIDRLDTSDASDDDDVDTSDAIVHTEEDADSEAKVDRLAKVASPVRNVDASMSAFPTGDTPDNSANSVTDSVVLPAVAASLSQFTAGYHPPPPTTTNATANSAVAAAASPRVDESLSAFTSGFSTAAVGTDPPRASVDTAIATGVDVSMSAFTTGYSSNDSSNNVVHQSVALPAVTQSLSAFTSGYEHNETATPAAADVPAAMNSNNDDKERASQASDNVAASLSAFTTGYELVNQRSDVNDGDVAGDGNRRESSSTSEADTTTPRVDQSLSCFTVGYEVAPPPLPPSREEIRVAATSSPEATVLSTISDLDRQLVAVTKTFEGLLPIEKSAVKTSNATRKMTRNGETPTGTTARNVTIAKFLVYGAITVGVIAGLPYLARKCKTTRRPKKQLKLLLSEPPSLLRS